MPIRPDLLHLYRTPEWKAARARILERAKNRCEQCGKPNGALVYTYTWQTWKMDSELGKVKLYHMIWTRVSVKSKTWRGRLGGKVPLPKLVGLPRKIRVVLTIAHRDNNPHNMADSNLACWCQWDHLIADRAFHRETRSARRDSQRPILSPSEFEAQFEALVQTEKKICPPQQ